MKISTNSYRFKIEAINCSENTMGLFLEYGGAAGCESSGGIGVTTNQINLFQILGR